MPGRRAALKRLRSASLLALALCVLAGCHPSPPAVPTPPSPAPPAAPSPAGPTLKFRDVAASAGLNYRWTLPAKRPLTILQTIGNGCAFLDYDNDGNLDVLLVGPKLALYKGDGRGHFTDVTHATGLDAFRGHFLGCAVGDYDSDGYDDVYISGYGTGLLLHNAGGKRFTDATRAAGLGPQPFGTSCCFADLDGDGRLDLFVCNYVQFGPGSLRLCDQYGVQAQCGPVRYPELKGVLYHNLGGGRFVDVTQTWGVETTGNDLGVACGDFDGSGRAGIAVANDELGGDLFQYQRPGRFQNINVRSGTSGDRTGRRHGGMGVDWGDYDNDGRLDFFVTTFQNEAKCLYRNQGQGLFTEQSEATGLQPATVPLVGFGCKFLDADNDGWLDLLIDNGHVQENIHAIDKSAAYRQPTLFLHNTGGSAPEFRNETLGAGLGRPPLLVGRGLSVGDYDNDGRVDALVVDSDGSPLLLHNETPSPGHWLGLRLEGNGQGSNRDGYGARVTVTAGGRTLVRECHADGSYLSSSDRRVHVGLGADASPSASVTVRWPDGRSETRRLPTDHYTDWKEGR